MSWGRRWHGKEESDAGVRQEMRMLAILQRNLPTSPCLSPKGFTPESFHGACCLRRRAPTGLSLWNLPFGLPQWHGSKEPACDAGDARDAGLFPEDPPEEAMATQYFAWRSPQAEPGVLQSIRSQRVGHT